MKKIYWWWQWWVVRDGCLVDTIVYDPGGMRRNPRLTYQEHKQTTVWAAMRVSEKDAAELEYLDDCKFREAACA